MLLCAFCLHVLLSSRDPPLDGFICAIDYTSARVPNNTRPKMIITTNIAKNSTINVSHFLLLSVSWVSYKFSRTQTDLFVNSKAHCHICCACSSRIVRQAADRTLYACHRGVSYRSGVQVTSVAITMNIRTSSSWPKFIRSHRLFTLSRCTVARVCEKVPATRLSYRVRSTAVCEYFHSFLAGETQIFQRATDEKSC